MAPGRPAAALSHHQTAELTDRLGPAAATSILDSSAALIDPPLAPPCSLPLQSYSTQGASYILTLFLFVVMCLCSCMHQQKKTCIYVVKIRVNTQKAHPTILVYLMNCIFK